MRAMGLVLAGIPWAKMGGWLSKASAWIVVLLKPFGAWGILGLSMVDSAVIPLLFLDPLVVQYGVNAHAKVPLYCLMGAVGSAIGSMLPYYLGRAGGELFLLKRINRERYEQLRDRFERQEFLAIMLPAMCPPPMPVKIVELAAGVLEMRPTSFFLAVCSGKFLRFFIESILVIIYGPTILTTALHLVRRHSNLMIGMIFFLVFVLILYILRRVFDRFRGIPLPVEETNAELQISRDDSL